MKKSVSSSILFSIIIIFFFLIMEQSTVWCLADNNVTFGCVPRERKALLRFKASMFDPSNRLSSWNTNYDDCCTWKGVECDKPTGHVTGLHLQKRDVEIIYDDYYYYGPYEYYQSPDSMLQSKTIDASSLLELKHLSYLGLSGNDFQRSSIPASLGSMKQLKHLNLSHANFSGIVPHQLGNLSSLHTLDLNSKLFHGSLLTIDDLMWASNLSSLEYLDLSYVNLNQTKDLIKVLSMLPSLVELRLSHSGLDNKNLPHTCLNSTILVNLQYLDLSSNSFEGEFPCFLQNMTSLSYLDLSDNHYNSIGPNFITSKILSHLNLGSNSLNYKTNWIVEYLKDKCHLKSLSLENNQFYGDISRAFKNLSGCWAHSLESLDLSINEIDGHLPEEFGELKHLTMLDVSENKFSGPIPSSLGNLRTFKVLDLSYNQLSGEIPMFISQLSNLDTIHFSYNNFSGPIPASLGNLTSLRVLSLYENQLSGEVPINLGQLSNLVKIDISHNSLEGTLSEAHFANLSKLDFLDTGGNNMLNFNVGDDWMPLFQLSKLRMQSNQLGGQFPQWLRTQKALVVLNLTNCGITGMLPTWLKSTSLGALFLPGNHIEGPITELPSSLELLNLSRNFINGSIPDSLCEMKDLRYLDLSRNQFSGILPDCWGNFELLDVVRLSSNRLSGSIPNSIGGAYSLRWLHLDNNGFTGKIPSTLKYCTMFKVLDVGNNKLSGKLPQWIGDHLLNMVVLRLRNNEFYGSIPSTYCQPSQLQIMDLANNNLTGNIPRCFGRFTRMVEGPNHSAIDNDPYEESGGWFDESLSEVVKGVMREYTKTIRFVINLDLSCNRLIGEIPSELTNLTGLIGLNLSHNHLVGNIPQNIGDMKSLESLDLSSNTLSGTIPRSVSKLTFITHLDFSNNDLSGQIPTGPQLQTLENTSNYGGNPGLCGPPLQKKCHIDETLPNYAKDGDAAETFYMCAFIISGLATGFWGYFGVLVFKRRWRLALFRCMDVVIGKMLGRH